MLELRSQDVTRITGETNPGRIVQKGLVVPTILKSKKRGAAGHRFAVFPDLPLFALNRQLHDLGFTDETVKPILRMIQRSYPEDLLAVRLVLSRAGASISAGFFDQRNKAHRDEYETVKRHGIIDERNLFELVRSTMDEIDALLTKEEQAELKQSISEFAGRVEARAGRRP